MSFVIFLSSISSSYCFYLLNTRARMQFLLFLNLKQSPKKNRRVLMAPTTSYFPWNVHFSSNSPSKRCICYNALTMYEYRFSGVNFIHLRMLASNATEPHLISSHLIISYKESPTLLSFPRAMAFPFLETFLSLGISHPFLSQYIAVRFLCMDGLVVIMATYVAMHV
jgi:hypothetical protein